MLRAVVVIGLGFGDEGKGVVTQSIGRRIGADLVVRFSGGPQAGHRVQLSDGSSHVFSQFGSCTLDGIHTHLASGMWLDLGAMQEEARHLESLKIADPFSMLSVDPNCGIILPYHRSLNRIIESRRAVRHGSCGMGVGEARRLELDGLKLCLTQFDRPKNRDWLLTSIEGIRLRCLELARQVLPATGSLPTPVREWREQLDEPADAVLHRLWPIACKLRQQPGLPNCSTVIFEGSQGLLLDERYGFHPHTTWSDVTPARALSMIAMKPGTLYSVIGVTRCYTTRHGDGPLPSYSAELSDSMSDPCNVENPWQGKLRCGWLDLPLLRYSKWILDGQLHGVAVNCLDQFRTDTTSVCYQYRQPGKVHLHRDGNLVRLSALCEEVAMQEPHLAVVHVSDLPKLIADRLGVPCVVFGRGPTAEEHEVNDLRWTGDKIQTLD